MDNINFMYSIDFMNTLNLVDNNFIVTIYIVDIIDSTDTINFVDTIDFVDIIYIVETIDIVDIMNIVDTIDIVDSFHFVVTLFCRYFQFILWTLNCVDNSNLRHWAQSNYKCDNYKFASVNPWPCRGNITKIIWPHKLV